MNELETPLAKCFHYTSKSIFAFQEVDGVEIFIFGMFVSEYGSDCQNPNAGRIFLEYMENVNFFRPKEFRNFVYQDIILSYLEFMGQAGYQWAHLFAFEDNPIYIFNRHPDDQLSKLKNFKQWYKNLLDKGVIENIIFSYQNMFDQAIQDKITTLAQLPYFANDYWPRIYEAVALKMRSEQKKGELKAEQFLQSMNGSKRRKNFNQNPLNKIKKCDLQAASEFDARIFNLMSKKKESFFVLRLRKDLVELDVN